MENIQSLLCSFKFISLRQKCRLVWLSHCWYALLCPAKNFSNRVQTLYSDSSFLKMWIRFGKIFRCIPIQLINSNDKSLTVAVINSYSMKNLKRSNTLAIFLAFLLLCQCIYASIKVPDSSISVTDNIINWFSFFLLSIVNILMALLIRNAVELAKYINGILRLDKISVEINLSKSSFAENSNRFLAAMVLFKAIVYCPAFLIGFHYHNSCKPSFIGFFLMEKCKKNQNIGVESLQRLIWNNITVSFNVGLLNVWVWYNPVIAATFATAVIMCVAPIIFSNAFSV